LDRNTLNYLVREETERDVLRIAAGKEAVKYKKKIRSREGNAILRECLRELYLNENVISTAMAHHALRGQNSIIKRVT